MLLSLVYNKCLPVENRPCVLCQGVLEFYLLLQTQRPEDVSLRVKLLRLYLKSGKLDHAYNVAVQTDRTMAFTDSLEWYETLLDVYYVSTGAQDS